MGKRAAGVDELVCPVCGASYPRGERFCPTCKLPLVYEDPVGEIEAVSESHERARKIKPQLTEGRLLEEGVPSMLRRSAGFDVPDFLAAGPRDVLVPEAAVATAREVLLEGELISDEPVPRVVAPGRLLAGLLVALVIGALVVWIASQIVH